MSEKKIDITYIIIKKAVLIIPSVIYVAEFFMHLLNVNFCNDAYPTLIRGVACSLLFKRLHKKIITCCSIKIIIGVYSQKFINFSDSKYLNSLKSYNILKMSIPFVVSYCVCIDGYHYDVTDFADESGLTIIIHYVLPSCSHSASPDKDVHQSCQIMHYMTFLS